MLRMRWESGIEHLAHAWLLFEPGRDIERTARMRVHTQAQCFETLEEYPRIERAHARPGTAHEAEYVAPDELPVADHGATNAAAVTIEILGGGVNDELRAELERFLQRRGAEAVVDCEQTPRFARDR